MIIHDEDRPLYTIGVVSRLLDVHPETLRVWERHGLIKPERQNRQRFYSNNDLKRLKFIYSLIEDKGLNLAGVKQVVELYPCWWHKNCQGGKKRNTAQPNSHARPCWKHEGTYCITIEDKADFCSTCELCQEKERCVGEGE
ncbi:MerR family transcriptional regulator [Calderihabitans maritimus]|uniref:Transcriptional regulator, MerR family n=1 Tax=Calderihabitans maritimus TaxID=1246530 RepID=A0A1Z5HUG3_9FIRM|nr:MerR family transcriptional regulator [Calderihabitans maritimus]GAW93048.1 Transcriptional regulator, MerR family [Calderihabitans maritimus]